MIAVLDREGVLEALYTDGDVAMALYSDSSWSFERVNVDRHARKTRLGYRPYILSYDKRKKSFAYCQRTTPIDAPAVFEYPQQAVVLLWAKDRAMACDFAQRIIKRRGLQ
ncbi:MAG: hypothetical protein ABWK00_06180 [Desulfurococcaceae archaeon]